MSEVSQQIGVSFAVEGTAADDVIRLNTEIAGSFGSQVRFDIRIADRTVTHVVIAHAGPRGAKADTIGEFALGDSAAPNATP